jgi:hypothetical protein
MFNLGDSALALIGSGLAGQPFRDSQDISVWLSWRSAGQGLLSVAPLSIPEAAAVDTDELEPCFTTSRQPAKLPRRPNDTT